MARTARYGAGHNYEGINEKVESTIQCLDYKTFASDVSAVPYIRLNKCVKISVRETVFCASFIKVLCNQLTYTNSYTTRTTIKSQKLQLQRGAKSHIQRKEKNRNTARWKIRIFLDINMHIH